MALNFNQYAAEGNAFLKAYANELNLSHNPDKAGRILTAVLHGLRSIISIQESFQFMAQLPMFLKAIYVNGWSMKANKKKVKNIEGFIELIKSFHNETSMYDFEPNETAEEYINGTFLILRRYVSSGEMEDIKDQLPKQLKGIIFNHIFL